MEEAEIKRAIEAILFAAGDPVGVDRMAIAIGAGRDQIEENLKALMDAYSFERRGMRIIRLEDAYQMVSAQELSEVISRALETRKPPKLSASALETLTVIAYYQPTTKAFVEQIRGVDSSYTISALLNKKLIEEQGDFQCPDGPFSMAPRRIFSEPLALHLWTISPKWISPRPRPSSWRCSCPLRISRPWRNPLRNRSHDGLVGAGHLRFGAPGPVVFAPQAKTAV